MCRDYPKCELDKGLTASCLCGDDTCSTGQYCNKGMCQDSKPKCEHTDGILLRELQLVVCVASTNALRANIAIGDIFDTFALRHPNANITSGVNCRKFRKLLVRSDFAWEMHLTSNIWKISHYCDMTSRIANPAAKPGHERCDVRADTYPITTSDDITFDYVVRKCQESFIEKHRKVPLSWIERRLYRW